MDETANGKTQARAYLQPIAGKKVAFAAAQAGRLTLEQWTEHRAFCVWCLISAGASFATAPLVIPEARAAVCHLSGGSS